MPVAPTYPGVYIEEIPSGVRTIAGVSTSVTAFIGAAKRGPINKATHVLSFPEFERRFGGLDPDSEMSYGVRQFFMNGGSDAWIVRITKDAGPAFRDLVDASSGPALKLTALDAGLTGNEIEVRVDYDTGNPASTFNLVLSYVPAASPGDAVTERFDNLSMNSKDARYVADVVNGASGLVSVERTVPATIGALGRGTSVSGRLVDNTNALLDVATLVDATHSTLRISANGLPPIKVEIAPRGETEDTGAELSESEQPAVAAGGPSPGGTPADQPTAQPLPAAPAAPSPRPPQRAAPRRDPRQTIPGRDAGTERTSEHAAVDPPRQSHSATKVAARADGPAVQLAPTATHEDPLHREPAVPALRRPVSAGVLEHPSKQSAAPVRDALPTPLDVPTPASTAQAPRLEDDDSAESETPPEAVPQSVRRHVAPAGPHRRHDGQTDPRCPAVPARRKKTALRSDRPDHESAVGGHR